MFQFQTLDRDFPAIGRLIVGATALFMTMELVPSWQIVLFPVFFIWWMARAFLNAAHEGMISAIDREHPTYAFSPRGLRVLFVSIPLPVAAGMIGTQVARWLLLLGLVGQILVGLIAGILFAGVLWSWQKERRAKPRRKLTQEEESEREEDRWIGRNLA